MEITFHKATEEDFDIIIDLHKQQEWGLDTPRAIKNFIEQGHNIIIAEIDGKKVGKVDLLQKKREGVSFLYIERLVIEKQWRNKGIGKKFLEYAENEAKKRGLSFVDVAVREDNPTALHLYQAAGFVSLGKKVYMRKKV